MNISKIEFMDFHTLYKVLTSSKITDVQKTQFVMNNRVKIKKIMENAITGEDFKTLMQGRVLEKFRPIKNSYTKWGDKLLLAKTLNIPAQEIPNYVKNVANSFNKLDKMFFVPDSTKEILKTYIYRHGSKSELVAFFDYELSTAKDLLKTLNKTLNYNTSGVADYFIRPIHRMDNKTLINLYNVINKNLSNAYNTGKISADEKEITSKWALLRVFELKENSKLITAIKNSKKATTSLKQ